MSPLGTFPVPQSGGSEVFWRETRVPGAAESIPLVGVAGAAWGGPSGTPSVGARHPAQTDARAEPCTRPARTERQAEARELQAQEGQPVLERPVPPPPTWTWKCRLTGRMGRVAWSLPWRDIQADLAWGHRRKEPINDNAWLTNQQ